MKIEIFLLLVISGLCDLEEKKQEESLVPESKKNNIIISGEGKQPVRINFSNNVRSLNVDGHQIVYPQHFNKRRGLEEGEGIDSNGDTGTEIQYVPETSTEDIPGEIIPAETVINTDNTEEIIPDTSEPGVEIVVADPNKEEQQILGDSSDFVETTTNDLNTVVVETPVDQTDSTLDQGVITEETVAPEVDAGTGSQGLLDPSSTSDFQIALQRIFGDKDLAAFREKLENLIYRLKKIESSDEIQQQVLLAENPEIANNIIIMMPRDDVSESMGFMDTLYSFKIQFFSNDAATVAEETSNNNDNQDQTTQTDAVVDGDYVDPDYVNLATLTDQTENDSEDTPERRNYLQRLRHANAIRQMNQRSRAQVVNYNNSRTQPISRNRRSYVLKQSPQAFQRQNVGVRRVNRGFNAQQPHFISKRIVKPVQRVIRYVHRPQVQPSQAFIRGNHVYA